MRAVGGGNSCLIRSRSDFDVPSAFKSTINFDTSALLITAFPFDKTFDFKPRASAVPVIFVVNIKSPQTTSTDIESTFILIKRNRVPAPFVGRHPILNSPISRSHGLIGRNSIFDD